MNPGIHSHYNYGPLHVIVSNLSGQVVAVQCRIDGVAAASRYRPQYINTAVCWALHQHNATHLEG